MVEQGTENPRVGGSIPSLATFLLRCGRGIAVLAGAALVAGGAGGCTDECEAACRDTTDVLATCMAGWPMDWSDLGAADAADFRDQCIEGWNQLSGGLESWELEEALETCQELSDALASPDCDVLLARYAP